MLKIDEEWHVFGTAGHYLHGYSFGALRRAPLALDLGREASRVREVWGFSPHQDPHGDWQAYASLHYGQFRTVIAHFTPDGDLSRWRLERVLLGSLDDGTATCYDPRPFTGEDGCLYLTYSAAPSRHRNVAIFVRRMLDASALDPSYPARTLLRPEGYRSEDRNPGYIQLVEGANLVRVEGKYALLYSAGDFARNNYKLGIAWSDELVPEGGYRKAVLPDPCNVWRNAEKHDEVCYLLQSEHKGWPNYCGHFVRGPGFGNLVQSGDDWRLLFHGYRPDDRRRNPRDRTLWSVPAAVAIDPGRPASHWLRPLLPR